MGWAPMRRPIVIQQFYSDEFHRAVQINDRLAAEIPTRVNKHLNLVLPGLVSGSIAIHLPSFLRDNSQMQRILDTHLETVKEQVTDAAKKKVNEIVNEDEYHTINKAFFDSVRQRADEQFQEVEKQWRPRLEVFDKRRQEIDAMQEKTEELTNQVNTLRKISIACVGLSIGIICTLFGTK